MRAGVRAALAAAMALLVPAIGSTQGRDAYAIAGRGFLLQPVVNVPGGSLQRFPGLRFEAENLPAWMSIDPLGGALSGTPALEDTGIHHDIRVWLTNGISRILLDPVSLAVVDPAIIAPKLNAATTRIRWLPPLRHTDGTPITDLAGYIVYIGRAPDQMQTFRIVPGAVRTSLEFTLETPVPLWFSVAAVTRSGAVGEMSAPVRHQ